jgi:DNA polymerase-3 subunit epsilon
MIISCIDVETTGLDHNKDRIVQLSVANFDSETGEVLATFDKYILPSGVWHMTPGAEVVHNLSEEFIKEKGVSLRSVYQEFMKMINLNPILTYNGSTFDIAFIQKEFEREGLETGFDQHEYIDSFDIERRVNSNKLGDTYLRYFGKRFDDAHNSMSDVSATIQVYMEQNRRYKLLNDIRTENDMNVIDESNQYVTKMMRTSPEGFVYIDKDGVLRFRVGKYKEYPVVEVCKEQPSYIKWLFTPNNGDNVISTITKKSIKQNWYENK